MPAPFIRIPVLRLNVRDWRPPITPIRPSAPVASTVQKFYLHEAATALGFPSPSKSATLDSGGGFYGKSADAVHGSLQVSHSLPHGTLGSSPAMGAQFVAGPLAAQTIAAGNWVLSFAASRASGALAPSGSCVIYVYRPSTGLKVGDISDAHSPTQAIPITAEALFSLTVAGSSLSILDGDVLVIEVWTETLGTTSGLTLYYDGATEGSTTSEASNILAPAAIALYVPAAGPIVINQDDIATSSDAETIQQTRDVADAATSSDAVSSSSSRLVSDAATTSDAVARSEARAVADATTPTDVTTRQNTKSAADSVTPTDAAAKAQTRTVADSVTPTDAVTRSETRAVADSVTTIDATTRKNTKAAADSVSATDATSRINTRAIGDGVTVSDSTSIQLKLFINVNDSVIVSEAAARLNTRVTADSVSETDSASRSSTRSVADSAGATDGSSRLSTRGVADTSSATDASARKNTRGVSESVTSSDVASISEFDQQTFSDTVVTGDSVTRRITLFLHDDVTVSDSAQLPTPPSEEPYVSVVPYGPAPWPRKGVTRLLLEFADSVAPTDRAEIVSVRKSSPKKTSTLYVSDILDVPLVAVEDPSQDLHDEVIALLMAGVI